MTVPDSTPRRSMGLLPSESKEAIKGGYQPPSSSEPSHVEAPPNLTTASLYGSKDALAILEKTITPSSLLFDPKYTSRERPSPRPPFRTFPPSPKAERLPVSIPSTISVQNLDKEEPVAAMDKRHPSSFQQLEKLGEGTYATVCVEHDGNSGGYEKTSDK
jgi:negative regulator of the PHO system